MKKIPFFTKSIPFGKMRFWGVWKNFVFIVKKRVSVLFKILLNLILTLILSKNKLWKKLHFLTKSMGKPLWKNVIYGTAKNFYSYGKKKVSFFSFKVIEYFFHFYFDQIEIQKNLAFFDLKHGLTLRVNPFRKMRFLGVWKFLFLSSKKKMFVFFLEYY